MEKKERSRRIKLLNTRRKYYKGELQDFEELKFPLGETDFNLIVLSSN